MEKNFYGKLYDWEKLPELFNEFLPELTREQENIKEEGVIVDLPEEIKREIENIGFKEESREAEDVARELIEKVYPYRMKGNHPRYFCFIPGHISPYSVFGDVLNSVYNPFGGGYSISKATATLELETIKWMGEQIGYDKEKLGGQFVSGGSMANLTAAIIARDDKLTPEEFIRGTVYVSDQTHSSVAKAVHLMGIDRKNVRKISTDENFKIKTDELVARIEEDIKNGYRPFLLVGSCGTTNTGSIDDLEKLGDIKDRYNMWYHVDGAYGASAIISSHKELLKGIEKSDSISWDGHKWLFQTYGCAAVICRDKMKMLNTFSVDPEYLKDVEAEDGNYNFWDMGMELTKPARGMRLWFTLQTVGLEAMKNSIDYGFKVADWIEEEIRDEENFEIVSHSQMGIINFRYVNTKYSPEELDDINRSLSQRAIRENYAAFLTTELRGKIVLRFCCNSPLITKEEVLKIISDLKNWVIEYK